MDLVLGLSMTSAAVRMVLVEGASAEGATIDHDAFGMRAVRQVAHASASDRAVDAVLGTEAIVVAAGHRLRSIGVTWTDDADAAASMVLETLAAEGIDSVVAVPSFAAAEALAVGLAGASGYDELAVCVVEREMTLVSLVKARDGAVVDRIRRIVASADPVALITILDSPHWDPQQVFVVGSSSDRERVAWELDGAVSPPVVLAAEAELALARGAALASAPRRYADVDTWVADDHDEGSVPVVDPRIARLAAMDDSVSADDSSGPAAPVKVRALTYVLVAAVLTFVVSLSVALGLRLAPDHKSETAAPGQVANAAPEPKAAPSTPQRVPPAVQAPPVPQQLPPAPPPEAPPPEAPPPAEAPAVPESVPDAQSIAAAPAPAPQSTPPVEQQAEPPAGAPVAPPPAAPPLPAAPPPAYVPPAQNPEIEAPPKHPILSKIPLIRRLPGVQGPADPEPPPDQGPPPAPVVPPDAPPPPP